MLAVSDDKLPDAREEAEQVAGLLLSTTGLLQITSETGAAATRNALLAAKNDAVLHVAAHGTLGMDGAAFELADRQVPALEISALQVAPALAVLSACDAAESDDLELAGSLAAGFLGAGSQHVVVEAAMPRDPQHPGAQRCASLEARQVTIDLDEHLLANFIGQMMAVRHRIGEAVHLVAVAIHQQRERAPHVADAQRGSNIAIIVDCFPSSVTGGLPHRHADKAPSSGARPTRK